MRGVWLALCLSVVSGAATAVELPVTSRIDRVTVYPSGAEATRLAKIKLDAGEHALILNDLPASITDGSVRVEGKATGKLEIGSVDTRRLMVPHGDTAQAGTERRRLEDELEKLRDQRAVIDGAIQAAETQKTLAANLAQLPAKPQPRGDAPPENWRDLITIVGGGMAEASRALVDAQVKARGVDRRIADVEGALAALPAAQQERTEVKVFVTASAALEADLTIRYQVPNASWVPTYDARLTTGSKDAAPALTLTRRAAVSQTSGEAWDGVALELSTSQTHASSAAPELQTITVDFTPPPKPVAAAPPPSPERRRQLSQQRMGGAAADADQSEALESLAAASPVAIAEQSAPVANMPFQALFGVPGRASIPSTGEAKRVQLGTDALAPKLLVRSAPKADTTAYLYAKLEAPKGAPLLPGAVSLFRDGTFVGTGQIPVLAAGEPHELGFGADDQVRVKHTLVAEKRGESGLISTSKTDERQFRITAKNLHERAIEVAIVDQIPVSENDDIKVELTGRSSPTTRDVDGRRGILAWVGEVGAGQETTIEFGYRVSSPADKPVTYGQ